MARRYLGPRWEPPQRKFDPQSAHDNLLKDAEGSIRGYRETYVNEFEHEAEAIEQNDELSPKGKERAMSRLVEKYENLPAARDIADTWIERADRQAAQLEAVLNKRLFVEPTGSQAEQIAELIARENRKHRSLLDFRQLSREQKHDVIWGALDKAASSASAREMLQNLMDDGQLDAALEKRTRMVLRRAANPEVARALEELVGGVDYTGEPDPMRPGALTVAKMSRDSYRRYIRERAGIDLSLDQLVEQHGVPKPVIAGTVMQISRAAASNAAIFRAAEAEAQSKRLTLQVEPVAASSFGNGVAENGEE